MTSSGSLPMRSPYGALSEMRRRGRSAAMKSGASSSLRGDGPPHGRSRDAVLAAPSPAFPAGARRRARVISGVDAFRFQGTATGFLRALTIAGSLSASLRALCR
eukprot:4115835-Prymnesium_polylepis.1